MIEKIEVNNGFVNITLDSSIENNTFYVDSLDNYANIYSDNPKDHTWVVTVDREGNSISFDLNKLNPKADHSAFTVLIDGELGFYYNEQELYNKEICLLTEYCSTCLDKAQKEREVLFIIKHELLKYAKENNLVEDQISTYMDIARMLNIDVKFNAQNIRNCRCMNKKCCNSCCSIC